MHGRIKVKTTAEQQEEKRIEREKKAKAFTCGIKQVFEFRGCEDREEETMKLTEKLLSGNPDVYTLWNIRKEIFVNYQKRENENLDKLLNEELKFLQNCLLINPKSYGVWNHRHFVMNTMTTPNWLEELHLCNLFLKYDERNFHCWDYRRYVVRQSNVSPVDELEFTMKKITDNFSNYSAWHNRSKLLPLVHPDPEMSGRIDEPTLLKEFNLVQNAFFTDPNDQSAWFYQRWLLGRRDAKPRLLSVSLHRSETLYFVASFSHPVNLSQSTSSDFTINGEKIEMNWKPTEEVCNGISVDHSCVWIFNFSFLTEKVDVTFSFPEIDTCPPSLALVLPEGHSSAHLHWTVDRLTIREDSSHMFSDNHTIAKTSLLEGELESLNILLEEEPENKWTMLTIIFLMRALDGLKYVKETEDMLEKLIGIDGKRKGYYKDLRSKYRIEDKLQKLKDEKNVMEEIDLSAMDLTAFYYGQYFTSCKKINLSSNGLSNATFMPLLVGVENIISAGSSIDFDIKEHVSLLPLKMEIS